MRGDWVYLVQTDTTVGFLSQSASKLQKIKKRPGNKPFLTAIASFSSVRQLGRVPIAHRRFVRKSVKKSFILPTGHSFRLVWGPHRRFIQKFGWCYTTSANRHGLSYDPEFARKVCDVVVESKEGFSVKEASSIWRLGREKKMRIR